MVINLYQSYYDTTQIEHLSVDCIPFDNTKNESPELREYPLFKGVKELEKDNHNHWGLLSWRFQEKTLITPKEFKDWIQQNPGHDVYYIDPFLDVSVSYPNLWVQGERWHPGLFEYFERLMQYICPEISAKDVLYHPNDFVTCNFFVGNNMFWHEYFTFVDSIISLSKVDSLMNYYMFEHKVQYNGQQITYFSFIIERLLSLYFYLNPSINKNKFPIEHECFHKKYGENHSILVNHYKSRL